MYGFQTTRISSEMTKQTCNDLKDDDNILRHLPNLYAISNSIIRTFHHCSVGVKLNMFHPYCCTIYCSQYWENINKGTYLKVEVAYGNIHRWILGYHWWDRASFMFVYNAIKVMV